MDLPSLLPGWLLILKALGGSEIAVQLPIYMDHHATTPVDARVVQAMLPYFTEIFGNPGSVNHAFGEAALAAVDRARATIARGINASTRELIFTSGATESNNLAIRGVAERTRRRGSHLISVTTEHKAVLDPLARLARRGFELTLLSPSSAAEGEASGTAGLIDPEQVADALRDDTLLVSVMLANNEIGAIQPIAEIGALCRARGVLLHCDATQAVGKIPVDVEALNVDLLSCSAHKIYGPKGVGVLYLRRSGGLRLQPQIDGGGQEWGARSGTLNVPGIVGFAKALELCLEEMPTEQPRLAGLRDRLCAGLLETLDGVTLNGPALDGGRRLAGNANLSFHLVDGEALMMNIKDLAVSSGSACTSANPEPSHVLRALQISEDLTRASLRFGLGRSNTVEEVDFAIQAVAASVRQLRQLSSMR